MYSESSLESTVQRCGTCGPSHGHERHRCQPAKGTACRVRTIVDVPALGDLNVLRSKYSATASVLVLHPPPAPTVNVNLPTMASVPSSPTSPLSPLPTQTYHTSILPRSIPTAALLDSAVGGAHYSGVESVNERRRSVRGHTRISHEGGVSLSRRRSSGMPSEPNPFHLTVLDDIKDVRDSFSPRPGDAIRIYPWFFLMVVIDVRRFCDEGDVAEAMAEGCGVRGALVSLDLGTSTWIAYLMGVTYVGSIHEV